jgi:hypothetical protein
MTTGQDCFHVWAPDQDFWSQWAKPVVFANAVGLPSDAPLVVPTLEGVALPGSFGQAAIVVDLPGEQAVLVGLALAERGYRPVPMFNGTSGPNALIAVEPIERALGFGTGLLRRTTLTPDARPAFLLDAERLHPAGGAEPGRYDNRWIVLPQDFPSATLLMSRGITDVTVIRQRSPTPDQDLIVVLRRWQEAGLRVRGLALEGGQVEEPLSLIVPSGIRWLWYGALALMGLRRNSVGGFGALVPEQTQRSGFYG